MGLRVSHGCWRGPYSSFHWWRSEIAKAVGIALEEMQGYSERSDAVAWSSLKPDVLSILLTHSDYDGMIAWEDCRALADRLQELLSALPQTDDPDMDARIPTRKFIRGLRLAATRKQNVEFC